MFCPLQELVTTVFQTLCLSKYLLLLTSATPAKMDSDDGGGSPSRGKDSPTPPPLASGSENVLLAGASLHEEFARHGLFYLSKDVEIYLATSKPVPVEPVLARLKSEWPLHSFSTAELLKELHALLGASQDIAIWSENVSTHLTVFGPPCSTVLIFS